MLPETFLNCQILRRQIMPDLLSTSTIYAASKLRQEPAANEFQMSLAIDI